MTTDDDDLDLVAFGPLAVRGEVEESVLHDLAALPASMRRGGVSQVARYCARQLDQGALSPRDAAGFAREVRLALAQLRDMAPGEVKGDVTDEVRERRERRLAGG